MLKYRPAKYSDWADIVRLERIIFPEYSDTFDKRFFLNYRDLIGTLIEVQVCGGIVQGYLCIAPLTEKAVSLVQDEGLTSLRDIPPNLVCRDVTQARAMFFEVIAAAPWSKQMARQSLLRRAYRRYQQFAHCEWYACPITSEGLEIATRMGFKRTSGNHLSLFVGPNTKIRRAEC